MIKSIAGGDADYMAVDQYGYTLHSLGKHPRKALVERTGCQHVSKMYRDKEDGTVDHVGYVVGPHWFALYEVIPFRGR